MKLKLISDGTERNTALLAVREDGSTERMPGIMALRLSCAAGSGPSLEISFARVPIEMDLEINRKGGSALGSVRYLCGCVRHYFSQKEVPAADEKCPYHGEAVQFEKRNVQTSTTKLVTLGGVA